MSGDATKGYSHRTIEMTPEHYAKAIELAMAATDATNWGQAKTEDLLGLAERTNPDTADLQWSTYTTIDGEDFTVAVTGNGPTSEANARFLVDARAIVLGMAERIDQLETLLRAGRRWQSPSGRHA